MGQLPFRVDVARHGRRLAVSVVGELDYAASLRLDEALQKELADADVELVFDFSQLTFLDSEGLKVLLRAYHRVGEAAGAFSIIGCSVPVVRLFSILGLTKALNVQAAP